jgi:RNA polymerase sigma-70 factor (ECF subfamily)
MDDDRLEPERLIETWRGPLVGLLAGWGATWTEAANLAQDTLVEAYLGRERLRGDPRDSVAVGPWLRGIARHLYLASRRSSARQREEPLEHEPPVRSTHPEDARLEALRRAMARLPEQQRTVLYLHYLEETGVREVAALLGVPESTVEGRLYKARRALRAALGTGRGAAAATETKE